MKLYNFLHSVINPYYMPIAIWQQKRLIFKGRCTEVSRHLMKCKVDRFGFEDKTRPWLSDGYLIMHVYLTRDNSERVFKICGGKKMMFVLGCMFGACVGVLVCALCVAGKER